MKLEHAAKRTTFYDNTVRSLKEPHRFIATLQGMGQELDCLLDLDRPRRPTLDADAAPPHIHELAAEIESLSLSSTRATETTARLGSAVRRWASRHGWRVEAEVVSLQAAVVNHRGRRGLKEWRGRYDFVAYPDGLPAIAMEIDNIDNPKSLLKLKYALAQGWEAVWIRWGVPCCEHDLEGIWVLRLPFSNAAFGHRNK